VHSGEQHLPARGTKTGPHGVDALNADSPLNWEFDVALVGCNTVDCRAGFTHQRLAVPYRPRPQKLWMVIVIPRSDESACRTTNDRDSHTLLQGVAKPLIADSARQLPLDSSCAGHCIAYWDYVNGGC